MNNALRSRPFDLNLGRIMSKILSQRMKAFGFMIIGALLAFEVFNYSTTEFALNDVLGNLSFAGLRWATILSIAFCGIDFAGVARLFTSNQGNDEVTEVWYLFGAWVLAAAMNATLTWWGVSVAIANHTSQGASLISSATIQAVVPVFVALMVWVIRILIIGTFSLAGERMFGQADNRARRGVPQQVQQQVSQTSSGRPDYRTQQTQQRPATSLGTSQTAALHPSLAPASSFKSAAKPNTPRTENTNPNSRYPEPTYHNLANSQQLEKYEERL